MAEDAFDRRWEWVEKPVESALKRPVRAPQPGLVELGAESEGNMTDIELNVPNIVTHLKNGATLHRHEDIIELNIPDTGSVKVPVTVFDSLVDQHLVEKCAGGFYKLPGVQS